MAAPAYKNFTQAVLSDTGTISTPADTAIGDLVVIAIWSQSTNAATLTHTAQNGFTMVRSHSHDDGTTDGRLSVAVRVATAASTQSHVPFAIANATAGQTCVGLITVTGADTTTVAPGSWTQNSATNTGTQTPNLPAITLSGDVMVVGVAAWHVTTAGATLGTPPANYTARVNGPTGSHLTHLEIDTREMTGASGSEDPASHGDNVTPNGTATLIFAIPALGVALTKNLADPLTLNEAGARTAGFVRSQADPLSLGDLATPFIPPPVDPVLRNKRAMMVGLDALYRIVLPIPDGSITAFDRYQLTGKYAGLGAVALTLNLTEPMLLGDTRAAAAGFARSQADAMLLAEAVAKAAAFLRNYADAITLGENLARQSQISRALTEAIALGEALSKAIAFQKSLTDPLLLVDTVTRFITLVRSVTDALALSDTVTTNLILGLSKALGEPLSLADVIQLMVIPGPTELPGGAGWGRVSLKHIEIQLREELFPELSENERAAILAAIAWTLK